MEIQNKIPPYDTEAEQAVLGSMLFKPEDAIPVAYERVNGDDFYASNHKIIFEAMIELFTKNIPVDLITLKSKLDEKNLTSSAGGKEYLVSIANSVPTATRISHYLKIVEDKSILRKLIKAAHDISVKSYEAKGSVESIMDSAEQSIFGIIQNKSSENFSHIREILVDSIQKIEALSKTKDSITGIPTGFVDFDNKTAGLQASDLILIAARPSMGKTAFALNIAQNAAIRKGIPTAVFSLEMSKQQMVNRLISSEAMLDAQKIRTGDLEQEDWGKIARSIGSLSDAPLYINDTPNISIMELRAKCRKLKLEKGLGLILIDYLQLMSGGARNESRQQEISEISRSLKALAREVDAPVIALSQLSRACEARADKRPMLSDLRESGAIEQDADVVAFLYRDEYYNPETEKKNQAEVIIAKQRNGPTGTVDLMWLGAYTKFASMQQEGY